MIKSGLRKYPKKKQNQKTSIRSVYELLRKENEHLKRTIQTAGGSVTLNSEEPPEFSRNEKTVDWQKVLYKKQPYPDNYVPHSFLTSLITNKGVKAFRYWSLVRGTAVVTQQICSVAIFMVMFSLLYEGSLSAKNLLVFELFSSALIYHIGSRLGIYSNTIPEFSLLLRLVILFALLLAVSPILHTLTFTISTDTICALVVCLSCIHVDWADYSESTQRIGALSVNSGLFVSVLLASRLPSPLHSTSLIYFAVGIFGFFPLFRKSVNQKPNIYLKFSFFMFILTCGLLSFISFSVLLVFIIGILFLTFICPLWLKYMQRHKFLISGPWDEALPTLRGPTCFKC